MTAQLPISHRITPSHQFIIKTNGLVLTKGLFRCKPVISYSEVLKYGYK